MSFRLLNNWLKLDIFSAGGGNRQGKWRSECRWKYWFQWIHPARIGSGLHIGRYVEGWLWKKKQPAGKQSKSQTLPSEKINEITQLRIKKKLIRDSTEYDRSLRNQAMPEHLHSAFITLCFWYAAFLERLVKKLVGSERKLRKISNSHLKYSGTEAFWMSQRLSHLTD